MEDIKKYYNRFGVLGLTRFIVYPITLILTTPYFLVTSTLKTIWTLLSNKNISKYHHFNLTSSLVSYFYSTRAWNLKKFGRKGKTKFLGLGDYYLARCFNYSFFSLFAYWKYGALTVFIGMFCWLSAYFIYPLKDAYFFVCMGLTLCSSLFYSNTFRSQNYNVIGWIFFPFVLYGIFEANALIVSISLLLASFGSFTVVILGVVLSGLMGLLELDFSLMFSSLPALIKLLTHFHPFFSLNRELSKSILSKVLKAIGVNEKVKYHRKKTKSFDLIKAYFLLLDLQFILCLFLINNEIPVVYTVVSGLFLLNALKVRFMDDQSIYMLKMSTALMTILFTNNYTILPSFWLLVSPLPLLIGYYQMKVLDTVPSAIPIDLSTLENQMDQFLSKIQPSSKVLFAFEDPNGRYEDVFKGFRNYIELPIYRAMLKDIVLFPDWWAVFELNYEGADEIWGITSQQITENMNRWNCSYVITYTWQEKPIDELENHPKFNKISVFNWSDFDYLLKDYPKLKKDGLKWNLYEFKHKSTN